MKKILMTLTLALGAMIAIPATAQTTTETRQAKECCKKEGKKDCCKEGKKEEGKACYKEGKECKKGMQKAQPGKRAKAGKKMHGQRGPVGAKGKDLKRRSGDNPMMKGITLSADQQQKVKALREKNASAEKKAKADAKARSKEEMQKIRADFDKEMEKILDKDQLKQYNANKAELEAKRAAKTKSKK